MTDDYVVTDHELVAGMMGATNTVRAMFTFTNDGIDFSDAEARWPEPFPQHKI